MKEKIVKSLTDIVKLVSEFEESLKCCYKLKNHPFNYIGGKPIPSEGVLLDISYRFHGSGCTIYRNGQKLYYRIVPITEENNVKVSPREVMLFMKTYLFDEDIQALQSKDMHLIFRELEKDKFLKKGDGGIYEIAITDLK